VDAAEKVFLGGGAGAFQTRIELRLELQKQQRDEKLRNGPLHWRRATEFVQSIESQMGNTTYGNSIPFNLKESFVIFMVSDRLLSVRGCERGFEEAGSMLQRLLRRFIEASTGQAPLSFIHLNEAVITSQEDLKEHFSSTKTAKQTLLDAKTLSLHGFEDLRKAAMSAKHLHMPATPHVQ